MKKPIYNSIERWEMQSDSTLTAFRKLNLAVLHLLRSFDETMTTKQKSAKLFAVSFTVIVLIIIYLVITK